MAEKLLDANYPESEKPAAVETKKVYRRPALTKLGSLRDLTMGLSGGGAPDGMPARGTKRGGDFKSTDCDR